MRVFIAFLIGSFIGFMIGHMTQASAHGAADWINQMQLGCCGSSDCAEVADGVWVREDTGYRNTRSGEFVVDKEAKASVDGHYWECRFKSGAETTGEPNNGAIRPVNAAEGGVCLFVPAIGF